MHAALTGRVPCDACNLQNKRSAPRMRYVAPAPADADAASSTAAGGNGAPAPLNAAKAPFFPPPPIKPAKASGQVDNSNVQGGAPSAAKAAEGTSASVAEGAGAPGAAAGAVAPAGGTVPAAPGKL